MKKVITVVGARPQFVKAAALSRELRKRSNLHEILLHTGQHYDATMSDVFFDQMDIPVPKYNLNIGGKNHGQMTGQQLEKIEEILVNENPDWVLVYGDTNSTLAGALAAAKLHIPVAHVEAGLRSFNRRMPEEINRVLTDHVSNLLFAPTNAAVANLAKEGITSTVKLVGDIMYDAALFYKERMTRPHWFDSLNAEPGKYILCTIHRAENTDEPDRLREILKGLGMSGKPVILPLHPRTRNILKQERIELERNILVVEPVGYLEMVWLEVHAELIATDSGGVQKEAYFHKKPCITMREETEWLELVESGWNVLVGANCEKLASAIVNVSIPTIQNQLYGEGDTAARILNCL